MNTDVSWELYLSLSGMKFLEFTIWGAWAPVLASRILGPLKMSGKQLGWIYATLPLACILAPMAAGQVVDRWCSTELYMAWAHLLGGLFLLGAARATSFVPLFLLMLGHCLCFAPTLAMVNSLTFAHLPHPEVNYFRIRMWGAVSWVLIGWALTLWRRSGKLQVRSADSLILAAICAFVMGLFCFTLPHTPPANTGSGALPFMKAFSMLKDPNFLMFMLISFVVSTQLQFYYLGTSRFLEDIGTSHATIPAAMSVAQIAQVVAMAVILPYTFLVMGFQWTLAAGTAFWLVMFLVYARMRPRPLIIVSMALHGLAFAFFFDAAFLYINKVAPTDIRASAQGLYTAVTLGLGLFVGTQFTGVVMDHFRRDGKFLWRPIFLVPCWLLGLCVLAFIVLFKG
ncbi:MAG: MFS transporter [Verrucomicrobia bacterium]|nr:MFS transporter [Verrucomicrobiota bacterium]